MCVEGIMGIPCVPLLIGSDKSKAIPGNKEVCADIQKTCWAWRQQNAQFLALNLLMTSRTTVELLPVIRPSALRLELWVTLRFVWPWHRCPFSAVPCSSFTQDSFLGPTQTNCFFWCYLFFSASQLVVNWRLLLLLMCPFQHFNFSCHFYRLWGKQAVYSNSC